jgi:hypothetical protein
MKTIKPGQLARIKNKDKKLGAATHYNQLTVTNVATDKIETFLATDRELAVIKKRAVKNKEDVLPLEVKRAGKFWHWRRR